MLKPSSPGPAIQGFQRTRRENRGHRTGANPGIFVMLRFKKEEVAGTASSQTLA
jgi:hypothetical protein